jgi:TPR repeat protein
MLIFQTKFMSQRSELLSKARDGDAAAQFELACHYDFEPPKDRRRAVYWYRKAAEQGHAESQNHLGECLRDGAGTQQSCKEALTWFRRAAEQGNADAQVSLVK